MPNDTLLVSIPCDTIALLLAVRRDEDEGVPVRFPLTPPCGTFPLVLRNQIPHI